jgi:O-methyltransferase domain
VNGEETLWNLMRGALTSRALAIVADLGVADRLASGPQRIDDDLQYRVLRALASEGIFEEVEPGVFRNTEASELLRTGNGWKDFAHLFGGIWLRAVGELDARGEPTFERLYGSNFWSWLAEHPEERAAFDRSMEQGGAGRLARLETAELRDGETIVDVGGGNGSLLRALLERRPGLRGIVLDLPETVRDEATFGDRLEFVAGSFFERVPRGDVYLLSTILHDWDDEHATRILRTVRASADDDARLIVLDAVVEPGNEPGGGKWLDLLMLALLNGRERDESQWRDLLAAGGWEPVRIGEGVIEARCR